MPPPAGPQYGSFQQPNQQNQQQYTTPQSTSQYGSLAAPSSAAANAQTASGSWRSLYDYKYHRWYYLNEASGQTQWEPPGCYIPAPPPIALPVPPPPPTAEPPLPPPGSSFAGVKSDNRDSPQENSAGGVYNPVKLAPVSSSLPAVPAAPQSHAESVYYAPPPGPPPQQAMNYTNGGRDDGNGGQKEGGGKGGALGGLLVGGAAGLAAGAIGSSLVHRFKERREEKEAEEESDDMENYY